MAAALTIVARDTTSLKRVIADIAFSGTYTTNGEVTTKGFLADLGMTKIHKVNFDQGGGAATGKICQYDYSANKVKVFRVDQIDDPLEELPNATALADTIRAEFIGI